MPQFTSEFLTYLIILMPVLSLPVAYVFRRKAQWINWSTITFSLVSLLASLLLANKIIAAPIRPLSLPFLPLYLDALSIYFVLLVNLVAFFVSVCTIPFLNYDRRHNPRHNPLIFHTFLNLFHFTMLLVPMVDNLVILWIAIELTTIFSTVLVRYQRSRLSIEASWKFLMITTTGVIFALLGTLFLMNAAVSATASDQLNELIASGKVMQWSEIARPEVAKLFVPNFVILSFLFILIGYGTKAGLAPMHTWLPDGHGEAPSPVSALLSGVMLKSALYAILRFYTITNLSLSESTNPIFSSLTSVLLTSAGLVSLILATPFILKKNKFKRVLAYHSLEHMGIITFGIGIGSPIALFGALLHTLNHALTKALMFLIYGNIQNEYRSHLEMEGLGQAEEPAISGLLQSMPFSGTILGFGGLALVGSPPFNIFLSEFLILWAAIQEVTGSNYPWVAQVLRIGGIVLFIVTVTMIFAGLVGHLARLLLGAPIIPILEPNRSLQATLLGGTFISMLALILIFGLGVPAWPVDLPSLLYKSVSIVRNGVLP